MIDLVNRMWSRPANALWAVIVAALAVATSLAFRADVQWHQPELLLALTCGGALLGLVGATVAMAVADRRDLAEAGLLASALAAASVMPLVHGLVTPGLLYRDNEAFRVAASLSVPFAAAVAAPLLVPRSAFGAWAARRWRDWSLVSILGAFSLAAFVTFLPDAIPAPSTGVAVALAVGSIAASGSLSRRQLRIHELGGGASSLVASFALAALGTSALVPLAPDYSLGSWWLHAAGALGAVAAAIASTRQRRVPPAVAEVLEPVLTRDPLVALELARSPLVERFVTDLAQRSAIGRGHVVRTGETAIRVGERMGLGWKELRELGLAAMFHDIGKLDVPDVVVAKPDRLTAAEYEVVKLHTVRGERMLSAEQALSSVARIARSHHERVDGSGYPDGLVGADIPLAARIIAVCDALDAMTHDRPYRSALPLDIAIGVLHEHAGSQWDPDVIGHLVAAVASMPDADRRDEADPKDPSDRNREFSSDGAGEGAAGGPATVPADVAALLTAVDAEI